MKATSRSGLYDDGTPGEVFIAMAKEGSTISGLMDSLATSISYGLQYGVPLKFFVDKFSHVRFEPSGWTGQSAGALCEVDHGLHLPLAWREVSRCRLRHSEAGDALMLPTEPEPQQACRLCNR